MLKRFSSTRPLSIGTALLLPLAAVLVFSPWYQTNDDVAMRLIAEGTFVPDVGPLPFLMHVNIVLGKLLSLAYSIAPALPWYDLLMGASMTFAAAALLRAWMDSGDRAQVLWGVLFALFFLLPAFVAVQFSLVGLGCAAAGIVLLVRACVAPLEPDAYRRHIIEGALLILWGALVRFEGAVLMILEGGLLAIPFAIAAWRDAERRPRLRGAALAGAAACVLIVSTFALNQFVYAHARGWKEFYEYNLRRTHINEYIAPERVTPEVVQELATRVGWTSNDFNLFRNWFFTDPELYSLARVRQAESLFLNASSKPTADSRASRMKRGVELGKSFFVETRLAFVFMLAYFLARGATARLFLYLLGVTITIALLIAGISLALKAPPDRIFWPMLILGASMLPIAARRWGRPAHPALMVLAVLMAAYVSGLVVTNLWKQSVERRAAAQSAMIDANGLRQTGARFFVLHGNTFPYEDYWRPLHVEKAPFPFVALGVSARTPPVQGSLRKNGRTDLPLSLCTEPGLVIVTYPYIGDMLTTFMAEHHQRHVRFVPAFEGKRFTAWKCTDAAPVN